MCHQGSTRPTRSAPRAARALPYLARHPHRAVRRRAIQDRRGTRPYRSDPRGERSRAVREWHSDWPWLDVRSNMQPAGSPASLATSPASSSTEPLAPGAPPVFASALATLVIGQGGPPPAILLQRPPAVRWLEIAALVAIIALADLALYQGGGGAGLAVLFAGVPVVLFVASSTRTRSGRLAAIAALLALIAARCLWQSSAGAPALGMALLPAFAIALRMSRSFPPELAASALDSVLGGLRQLGG